MQGTFRVRSILSSVLGHSVHFVKFLMLRISKGCCYPSFHPISTKRYKKNVFWGKCRLLLFLAICQTLKVYGTLNICYLSYIASIHKAMLVSSAKSQAECQGLWASYILHSLSKHRYFGLEMSKLGSVTCIAK